MCYEEGVLHPTRELVDLSRAVGSAAPVWLGARHSPSSSVWCNSVENSRP